MNKVAIGLALALFFEASIVLSQPSGSAADADRLFTEGKAALDAGRLEEACDKLAGSLAIDRAAGTLINLARCHQLQKKYATSANEYREVVAMSQRDGNTERAGAANAMLAEIDPKIPRLTIALKDADAVVTVDGATIAPEKLGTELLLDPGDHVVRATAEGKSPREIRVKLAEAERRRVDIAFEGPQRSADPQPDPSGEGDGLGGLTIGGIVVGSVGIVGLAVGGVLGGMTLSEVSDAEEDSALCPNKECTPEGREVIDAANVKGIASTVALAVGGAAVAGGVVMIIIGAGADSTTTGARPIFIATPELVFGGATFTF